jgi:hypothetical protein
MLWSVLIGYLVQRSADSSVLIGAAFVIAPQGSSSCCVNARWAMTARRKGEGEGTAVKWGEFSRTVNLPVVAIEEELP